MPAWRPAEPHTRLDTHSAACPAALPSPHPLAQPLEPCMQLLWETMNQARNNGSATGPRLPLKAGTHTELGKGGS